MPPLASTIIAPLGVGQGGWGCRNGIQGIFIINQTIVIRQQTIPQLTILNKIFKRLDKKQPRDSLSRSFHYL